MRRRTHIFKLLDYEAVRDTAVHYCQAMLPLHHAENWGFVIMNSANQTVTWELIGGTSPNPAANGLVGVSGTIAAGLTEPILTELWSASLGVRISYATAPTSGGIEIDGEIQTEE